MVTVPSPHQEISSTHCEIRPGAGVDHGAAVVTDLGSTNGTVLVQPGLGPEDLRPGVPVVEQYGRRERPGVLLAVRADGHRLLVSLEAPERIRAYTLRRDGVYRLEGASDGRAPVLKLMPEAASTLH